MTSAEIILLITIICIALSLITVIAVVFLVVEMLYIAFSFQPTVAAFTQEVEEVERDASFPLDISLRSESSFLERGEFRKKN